MKRFSEDHAWVQIRRGVATVGITSYAADELGDINFVELPITGATVTQGDVLCVVESAKAASDVFTPVSGTIAEVNTALDENPGLISAGAENDGWICRLHELDESELEALMTEEEYEAFTSGTEIEDDE